MKGGNVVMLLALKALKDAGVLDQLQVTAVFTGDEEDRVEVANQQELAPGSISFPFGDQVTGPIPRRTVGPPGREPELLKLGRERVGYSTHPGKVVCAAIDVDQPLEQRNRLSRLAVNRCHHPAFGC
jgi:hypothetical protein